MPKLKIGELVKIVYNDENPSDTRVGKELFIVRIEEDGQRQKYFYTLAEKSDGKNTTGGKWGDHEVELVKSNSLFNRMKSLAKRLLDSDLQTLVKAGFLTESLELTSKGREAQEAIHFAADKAELVKLAAEELKEAENKK